MTDPRRVVKVALPAHLVERMDDAITSLAGYDRSSLVTDALDAFLTELQADQAATATPIPRMVEPPSAMAFDAAAPWNVDDARPSLSLVGDSPLALRAPGPDVVTVPPPERPAAEPTWGMHNRDWPSLWAAADLGRRSLDGPVPFEDWAGRLVREAFEMGRVQQDPTLDLSGFPTDRNNKLERSLGRFRSFFLGDAIGRGPLFTLALAAPARQSGAVLLTAPGADLLRSLDGLEPRKAPIRDDLRDAFLGHLAAWVPADFGFLRSVIDLVLKGRATRMKLLEAVAKQRSDWKDSVVATNVAGFIARGREWNLVDPSQEGGEYRIRPDALDALDRAESAAKEQRARYS